MLTKIYDLAYEVNGDTINLEQDMGCGDVARIDLHPIHVRLLAEQVGILAPSSNIEADRTIARLSRQLRVLLHRIDHLTDWLHEQSDTAHADLSYEQTYSLATWELANEFVADLPGEGGASSCCPGTSAGTGASSTSACASTPQASHTASLFDAASPAAAEVRQ